ncbi:MAG: DUF3473 domain-containing protein [Allosphingosinicella sp.]
MSAFLFSVDVEDPRLALAGGGSLEPRVPAMIERYLRFLDETGGKGTFFVVGEVARYHPETVRRVAEAGHEVGCHSDAHIPLERQDAAAFRDDLRRNLDALGKAGATAIAGYRAPCFSLTERTRWAYDVLAELGFSYSSSVLPARNPRYGWPGFGTAPRLVQGLVELPVSLLPFPLLPLPAGGLYFRVLPRALIRHALRRLRARGEPVASYFHPYDIDTEQRLTHSEFRKGGLYDRLMRSGRGTVFPRLSMAREMGFEFQAYGPHAERLRAALAS